MDNEFIEITKEEYDELLLYKENYEILIKEIGSLYNAAMCCRMSFEVDKIEEIEEI